MPIDFDEVIEFKNTHSQKWDNMAVCDVDAEDGLSMWVADMDFRPPQSVQNALQAELDRGVYGYYGQDASLRSAICAWMEKRHGWKVSPDWISFSHGVVAGLSIVMEAFSDIGDEIIIFTPVYHAFARKIAAKGRKVVESPLELVDGAYRMNLDALAASLSGKEKMIFFCSPHNPGGKLWSSEEINALAKFCETHDLLLISDEIHMDLTFPGHRHLPTATTAPDIKPRLITLSAASKGFNIAGAETSFIIVEDEKLRAKIMAAQASFGGSPNRFGMVMMEAAFTGGDEWLDAVRAYIAENFHIFKKGVDAIPGLSVMDMPSTYLVWVDFSGTGMVQNEFANRVAKDARIAVNKGTVFGAGGETYLRFNVATRRAIVEQSVSRLEKAFGDLQ